MGPLHGEQRTGIPHGVDTEDEVVEDRERRGDEPQAQGHGAHDSKRDQWARGRSRGRHRRASCTARFEEGDAAGVAAFLGGHERGAEARPCPCARLVHAQTGRDVLARFHLEDGTRLVVELPFDAAWRQQGTQAETKIAPGHGHAIFITRSMAVVMRSHSPASTASCRRPETVSR